MRVDEISYTPDFGKAYRNWKSWSKDDFGHCDGVEARYFEEEMSRSGVVVKAGMPLLEIGFGNGNFAAWANARQLDYTGIEIDPELVERAQERGWRTFPATLSLENLNLPKAPRCIVAFDVIEHLALAQLAELLKSVSKVLAVDGLFVVRLPSGDSPFARYIQHGDITHRMTLGSSAIRQLAESFDMKVVQIRSPALPLRGIGLRRALRRLGVLAVRWLLTHCIRKAFHGNQLTVITANMLVVLRKATTESNGAESA